jgi:hypothetical protein
MTELALEVPEDSISWVIDRIGDRSFMDEWNNATLIRSYPTRNSYAISTLYLLHSDLIFDYRDNNLIYHQINREYDFEFQPYVPSQIMLDETIEFTEEQCNCCICMDKKEEATICQLNCSHTFCVACTQSCILTFIKKNQNAICSLCRATVETITVKTPENKEILISSLGSSKTHTF